MERSTSGGETAVFHRKASPSQTAAVAEAQRASGEIWGKAPRNFYQSDIPKVKAFRGPLPAGTEGIEFTTNVRPSYQWGEMVDWFSPQVPIIRRDGEDYAVLKARITRVIYRTEGMA
jgi:hypothetical protein